MKNAISGIKGIILELKYIFTKKEKAEATVLTVVLFWGSMFELIGVSAVVPFIQEMINSNTNEDNIVIRKIFELVKVDRTTDGLIVVGGMFIFVYLFKNAYIMFANYLKQSFITKWQKDISIRMIQSYLKRPYEDFIDDNSAEILRGCTEDTNGLTNILNFLFTIVLETCSIILIFAFLVYTDWFIACCAGILIVIDMLGIYKAIKPRIKKAGIENKIAYTGRSKSVLQIVQGIKEITIANRKEEFAEEFVRAADSVRVSSRNYNALASFPDRITEGICVSGIVGIIIARFAILGGFSDDFLPQMAAFAMAAFRVLPSVGKISGAVNGIAFYRPMQLNIYQHLSNIPQIEQVFRKVEESDEVDILSDISHSNFVIRMDNITWKYRSQKEDLLNGLCLEINRGESVGIIGTSGNGKTTTVDILLGLLQPREGKVLINDYNLNDIMNIWPKIISYIPQNIFLLDDTIRANIVFMSPNVSDRDVWEALDKAKLSDYVRELPEGLDTVVGEQGVKLSGGQRQRIAIARALCGKPRVLVMDEATASLDNDTESALMEAIEKLHGQITLVIVAHRMTTIMNCDKIYAIENGKAVVVDKNDIISKQNTNNVLDGE